jgi:hypothetical protein
VAECPGEAHQPEASPDEEPEAAAWWPAEQWVAEWPDEAPQPEESPDEEPAAAELWPAEQWVAEWPDEAQQPEASPDRVPSEAPRVTVRFAAHLVAVLPVVSQRLEGSRAGRGFRVYGGQPHCPQYRPVFYRRAGQQLVCPHGHFGTDHSRNDDSGD